jgi:hypothetical protein
MAGGFDSSSVPTDEQAREELKHIAEEPLLPIEKRLILWSLGLGIVLLALLAWISHQWFPVP